MRHVGGQGVFLFSCFLFAACWAPCAGLDPHPHPGGSQTGKAKLPPALSQEGLRAEQGKDSSQGSRTHDISISKHPLLLLNH